MIETSVSISVKTFFFFCVLFAGESDICTDLFKYAELSALPRPSCWTLWRIEGWYVILWLYWMVLWLGIWLWHSPASGHFLEASSGKTDVFGMMLIMFDSLISSPLHPTLVTVVDSVCPVCPVKPVMVFLARDWLWNGHGQSWADFFEVFLCFWERHKEKVFFLPLVVVSVCDAWSSCSHLVATLTVKLVLSELWNHPFLEPIHVGLFMVWDNIYPYCLRQFCLFARFLYSWKHPKGSRLVSSLPTALFRIHCLDLHLVFSSATWLPGLGSYWNNLED